MTIDERVPRVAGGTVAAGLLVAYAATPWHTTTYGLVSILAAEAAVIGTGEYLSFRLRRSRR